MVKNNNPDDVFDAIMEHFTDYLIAFYMKEKTPAYIESFTDGWKQSFLTWVNKVGDEETLAVDNQMKWLEVLEETQLYLRTRIHDIIKEE